MIVPSAPRQCVKQSERNGVALVVESRGTTEEEEEEEKKKRREDREREREKEMDGSGEGEGSLTGHERRQRDSEEREGVGEGGGKLVSRMAMAESMSCCSHWVTASSGHRPNNSSLLRAEPTRVVSIYRHRGIATPASPSDPRYPATRIPSSHHTGHSHTHAGSAGPRPQRCIGDR